MGPIYDAFYNAKITAANVPQPGEQGSYTMSAFLEDFPQFCLEHKTIGNEETQRKCLVPESVLQVFVEQANDSVLPSRWGSMWRYAAGLYVAHFRLCILRPMPRHLKTLDRQQAMPSRKAWSRRSLWETPRLAMITAL